MYINKLMLTYIRDMKARRLDSLLGCPRMFYLVGALDRNSTAQMKRVTTNLPVSSGCQSLANGCQTRAERKWVSVLTASAGVDACVARSNRTLGLGHDVNLSVSITPDYSNTNFSLLLFSLFRNRINSVTLKKHYFINLLWIFSLEHKDIFPKENILLRERYGGVTWQRCLVNHLYTSACRAASPCGNCSTGASVSSRHHKHLTRQLYQLTRNESSGVTDHGTRGGLQGKI